MAEKLGWFRDFPPAECALRNHLFRMWRASAHRFHFQEFDGPILEPLELYVEKSGPEIVNQLFTLTSKGDKPKELALRPEMTPSLARMVSERAGSLKKPVKWFSIGEHFRYERKQRGRERSFYQFNADIFGEDASGADAELIALAVHALEAFGLGVADIRVRLSDRHLWLLFLEGMGITDERVAKILGVVDKIERLTEENAIAALEPVLHDAAGDFLAKTEILRAARDLDSVGEFLRAHAPSSAIKDRVEERLSRWHELFEHLEDHGVADYVEVDLGIVRGLAYYTGFVFEIFERDGDNRALAGGGRYDDLVERLGGPAMPAAGFGMGDVTLALCLADKKRLPAIIDKPDLFCVIGGPAERRAAVADAAFLRRAGYSVDYAFKTAGFGKQFKQANDKGARLALIYGSDELASDAVKIRDLSSGNEKLVRRAELGRAIAHAHEAGIDQERP